MQVELIQYLRPDGRKRRVSTNVRDDLAPQVMAILDAGMQFEVEELGNAKVSAAITDPEVGDFEAAVTDNGPALHGAIDAMIQSAARRIENGDHARWLAEFS